MPRPRKTTAEDTNTQTTALTQSQAVDIARKHAPHKRPKRSEEYTPHFEPGEVSTMLSHAMRIANFGPVDTNDADQVEQRIATYFDYCISNDLRPSAEGVALALCTNRTTLWRWKEGVESNKPEAVRKSIKKAYSMLNYFLTETMQNGHINPVAGIFLLKNNYQYYDKSEIVVTPNNPLEQGDETAIRDRYTAAIPDDLNTDTL